MRTANIPITIRRGIIEIQITRTTIGSIIAIAAEQQEAGRKGKPQALVCRYKGEVSPLNPLMRGIKTRRTANTPMTTRRDTTEIQKTRTTTGPITATAAEQQEAGS